MYSTRRLLCQVFSRPYLVRCSVCLSSVWNILWLNGASYSRSYYWHLVGSRICEKSIGTKINDLDLCLEVLSRSCQPLQHIHRWISQKPLEIEAWFQRTTNRKWPMGNQILTWSITSREPKRSNSWRSICLVRAQYLENSWRCLATIDNYYR